MSLITPDDLQAFLVLSEREGQMRPVLDHICRASYGGMLLYSDRSSLALNPETGTAGVGTLNTLTDSSKAWTASAFIGYVLVDSAGASFQITANTDTALTVSGTPASGSYSIYPMLTERYTVRYIRGEHLRLKAWPVRGIVTVYEDDDTTETLSSDDYQLFADTGSLFQYGGWGEPEYYWTVKYAGGYLPTDKEWPLLRHWQFSLADAMWNDSGYKRFVVDQFGNAKGTLNYDFANSSILDSINRTLGAQFRRITL